MKFCKRIYKKAIYISKRIFYRIQVGKKRILHRFYRVQKAVLLLNEVVMSLVLERFLLADSYILLPFPLKDIHNAGFSKRNFRPVLTFLDVAFRNYCFLFFV